MSRATGLLREALEAHRAGDTERGDELERQAAAAENGETVEPTAETLAEPDSGGEPQTVAEAITETEAEAAVEIAETHAEAEVAVAEAESEARQVEAEAESEARQAEAAAVETIAEEVEPSGEGADGEGPAEVAEDAAEQAEEKVEEVAQEAEEVAEEVVEPRRPESEHWWFRPRSLFGRKI